MDCYLEFCMSAAHAGGTAIKEFVPQIQTCKNDEYIGDRAIVSDADYQSQRAILSILKKFDQESYLLTEESLEQEYSHRMISSKTLRRLNDSHAYIIDELDGTNSFCRGHYEWSVSVAYIKRLTHYSGAIYAPKIDGGLMFYASLGHGSYMESGGNSYQSRVLKRNLKKSYVLVGCDCFLSVYPVMNRLIHILGDKAFVINSIGSTALSLGLVASGKVDAVIQPLQYPWDWAAGKVIIEEAGGTIFFFTMDNNELTPLKNLSLEHYDPQKRMVGFIAGCEELCFEILDNLLTCQRDKRKFE